MTHDETLIQVQDLKKYFPVKQRGFFGRHKRFVKAVDGLSLSIAKGETLGLVGESGCGKTTAGRTILHLYKPTAGDVVFEGQHLTALEEEDLRRMRSRMQMIFQDPYASLNPRMTAGNIIGEPLEVHDIAFGKARQDRVLELMDLVGLNSYFVNRYPHEFSGGQQQRIGIARALAVQPSFIVCDEPIASLDVSIQAQVVNLLEDLQNDLGLTYLFIAHDLSMVRHISNRVAVMYLGKIVEMTDRNALYRDAQHPYTVALLSAVPLPDPRAARARERIVLEGDVPNPIAPPRGCNFNTRCWRAVDRCFAEEPELREIAPDHYCACHLI